MKQLQRIPYAYTRLDSIVLRVKVSKYSREITAHREETAKKTAQNKYVASRREKKHCLLVCACDVICGKNNAVHDFVVVCYRIDNDISSMSGKKCAACIVKSIDISQQPHITQWNNHFVHACYKKWQRIRERSILNTNNTKCLAVFWSHSLAFVRYDAYDEAKYAEGTYLIKSCGEFSDEFIQYFYIVCSMKSELWAVAFLITSANSHICCRVFVAFTCHWCVCLNWMRNDWAKKAHGIQSFDAKFTLNHF